ncbi:hypothetical protein Osc1_22980 [Hominimerdicola sp. 21CYCFAH17_S]
MGLVPKQSKADTKIHKSFTMVRIVGLIITILLSSAISKVCAPILSLVFIILCAVTFLILSSKAPDNKTKSFFGGIKAWLKYLIFSKKLYGISHKYVVANNERRCLKNDGKKKREERKDEASETE